MDMSNNKQSSIEWLQAIELERDLTLADWNKAKAMHKEEIENAWEKGNHKEMRGGKYLKPLATQYYNETYGDDTP